MRGPPCLALLSGFTTIKAELLAKTGRKKKKGHFLEEHPDKDSPEDCWSSLHRESTTSIVSHGASVRPNKVNNWFFSPPVFLPQPVD